MANSSIRIESIVPGGRPIFIDENDERFIRLIHRHIVRISESLPELKSRLFEGFADFDDTFPIKANLCFFNEVAKSLTQKIVRQQLGNWAIGGFDPDVALQLVIDSQFLALSNPEDESNYQSAAALFKGRVFPNQIIHLLSQVTMEKEDVIVELGSGCGSTSILIAGCREVRKVVGIEQGWASFISANLINTYFTALAKFYAKVASPIRFIREDFMSETQQDLLTKEATIFFVNNVFFPEDLNFRMLTNIFMKCKCGTKIVSARLFAPVRIVNGSIVDDPSSILKVRKLTTIPNGVSWTARIEPFYLTTIDRSEIKKFLEKVPQAAKDSQNPSANAASSGQPASGDPRKRSMTVDGTANTSSTKKRRSRSLDSDEEEKAGQGPSTSNGQSTSNWVPPRDSDDEEGAQPSGSRQ